MSNLVIARFVDGRLVKGTSVDVDPAKPACHVRSTDGTTTEVKLAELKALFFVRDLRGDPSYKEGARPDPADVRLRGGRTIRLTFRDGEVLAGITHHFPPTRPFFFVLPMDPKSNNIRALVNRAAVAEVAPGPAPPAG